MSSTVSGSLVIMASLLVAGLAGAAQDPRDAQSSAIVPSSGSARDPRRTTSKGPLPDPALLDGGSQAPEKKPERGMLGEFEMPGDENARSGKVGGPQKPEGAESAQGAPSAEQKQAGGSGASQQSSQAANAGGAKAAESASNTAAGGQSGENAAQGAGAAGGAPGTLGSAGPITVAGDPNAKAEGIQVGQLGGSASGDQSQAGVPPKPQGVAIGDSAMQIQTINNAPNVVGGQIAGSNTQQMEKRVGQAAKASGGDNSNKGVEKGRTIPSGL